jgi:twitching motility protein PilT
VELAALRLRDALELARSRHASDLHLVAGSPPVLRVDGALQALPGAPMGAGELGSMALELLGSAGVARLESTGDLSIAADDNTGRIRVHAYRAGGAVSMAIRLLPEKPPLLESLQLPDSVVQLEQRERGLVLFSGPTGCGKSTTMAALVDRISASTGRRIISIEDPIEYRYPHARSLVSQREIGNDTPALADALRGCLRSDPDVVVVGEMRDTAAIGGALTVAETGHLVLATLHTGDAAQTVDRIIDAFDGSMRAFIRTQLALTLVAVVCQRLVRCKTAPGRRALVEVLLMSDAVRNLIREGKTHQLHNAMATGRQLGMQTFEQHAQQLVADGSIAPAAIPA